jgi:hypothetical protein
MEAESSPETSLHYQTTCHNEQVCVEATIKMCIQNVSESQLGHRMNEIYQWFSSRKCRHSNSIRPQPLPSKSFPIHHSSVVIPSDAI